MSFVKVRFLEIRKIFFFSGMEGFRVSFRNGYVSRSLGEKGIICFFFCCWSFIFVI